MLPTSRNLNLDILRAIAILLVLGRHMQVCPPDISPNIYEITQTWQEIGWIGVDLFFVLSGFLVSTILFKEVKLKGRLSTRHFLIRRSLKIYPSFYFFILFTVLYKVFILDYPVYWENILGEVLFLQNYLGNFWGYTWSLAVEEHFYLILPFFIKFLHRRSQKLNLNPLAELPGLVLLTALSCLILRIITAEILSEEVDRYGDYAILFATHLRLDSLMSGVLLAWLFSCGPLQNINQSLQSSKYQQNLYLGAGITLVLLPFLLGLNHSRHMITFGLSILYIGFALILLGVLHRQTTQSWLLRPVLSIGQCSYNIYLWHGPVNFWFIPALSQKLLGSTPLNWYAYALLYLLGSISLGCTMTHFIEKPVLRLRNYYFPSRVSDQTEPHRFL